MMGAHYKDTTPLYKKEGRRYVVACNIESVWEYGSHDVMKPGEFKLVYAYKDGAKRHQYGITPDTAGFVAAAMVAEVTMADAMHEAWRYTAAAPYAEPFTKKQQAAVAQARNILEAAGIFSMTWHHGAAQDVARAGIDAVRNFGKIEK